MAIDPIEEFVNKIDSLDSDINTASEHMMMGTPVTAQQVETFKSNILLRDKLNEQLVAMRHEKIRRDAP